MSVLEIRKFKDPVLRGKSRPIEKIDNGTLKIIGNMIETMLANNGVGLAAPQVGISKRIFVARTALKKDGALVLINPVITYKSSEKERGEEGCLSFPGVFLNIKRSKEIEVEGRDVNGKKVVIQTNGISARILQHEIDHLDGILFYNRLGLWGQIKFKFKQWL